MVALWATCEIVFFILGINMTLKHVGPFTVRPDESTEFKIFCFEGIPRKLAYLWCSPVVCWLSIMLICQYNVDP